jgi:hypothetical protein
MRTATAHSVKSTLLQLQRNSQMTFSLSTKKQAMPSTVPGGPLGALNANKFTAVGEYHWGSLPLGVAEHQLTTRHRSLP